MKFLNAGLGFAIVLCLMVGCKAMYSDNRKFSNVPPSGGATMTNDFINVHASKKPPGEVPVKIEATNSSVTIELQVKVNAKEPKETIVPLNFDVRATNKNVLNVSMAVSNSSSLIVPVTLSNCPIKEIIIPIKIQIDTNYNPSVIIPSDISLKLDDDFKALLKELSNRGSDEPPKMKPTEWFEKTTWLGRHEWLLDFAILFGIVAASGAAGGVLRTKVDKTTELESNIIFGITAACLVPIALYLKERKIFELGITDPLLLLVLVSASLAAGLIGAVFVQWFYMMATKMFQENKTSK